MITLNQVLLLEQKIEGAVEKIRQLEAENDALRKECSELKNSLYSKTEQLSSFESNQSAIESGIIKALERLDAIENSVLHSSLSVEKVQNIPHQEEPISSQNTEVLQNSNQFTEVQPTSKSFDNLKPLSEEVNKEDFASNSNLDEIQINQINQASLNSQIMDYNLSKTENNTQNEESSDDEDQSELGFDIF